LTNIKFIKLGGSMILKYYGGIGAAIKQIYNGLIADKDYSSIENQKKLFLAFEAKYFALQSPATVATTNQQDNINNQVESHIESTTTTPILSASDLLVKQEQWYAVPASYIQHSPINTVLRRHYGGSIALALAAIYPTLVWDETKFKTIQLQSSQYVKYLENFIMKNNVNSVEELVKQLTVSIHNFEEQKVKKQPYLDSILVDRDSKTTTTHNNNSTISYNVSTAKAQYLEEQEQLQLEHMHNTIHKYFKGNVELFVNSILGTTAEMETVAASNTTSSSEITPPAMGQGKTIFSTRLFLAFNSSVEAHRKAFENYAAEHRFTSLYDWYRVTISEALASNTIGPIIRRFYSFSLISALRTVFPEHESWSEHKFTYASSNVINDKSLLLKTMKLAETKLGITEPSQWYFVNSSQLSKYVKRPALNKHGGFKQILKEMYPNFVWNESSFCFGSRYAHQKQLFKCISELFPNETVMEMWPHGIIEQEDLHKKLRFSKNNKPMYFDIAIPSLKLIVELNGAHHYEDVEFFGTKLEEQVKRDHEKRVAIQELGYTVVEVPAKLWKGNTADIAATIQAVVCNHQNNQESTVNIAEKMSINKRDLQLGTVLPQRLLNPTTSILENEQEGAKNNNNKHTYSTSQILTLPSTWSTTTRKYFNNYWMQEKVDGMRAYYVPSKGFFSRSGKQIQVPQEWLQQFEKMKINHHIDGELWMGRGKYDELHTAVMKTSDYSNVKFVAFDVIDFEMDLEERWKVMRKYNWPKFVQLLEPVKCKNVLHVKSFLTSITSGGGEGIILRQYHSLYTPGRSTACGKLKLFKDADVKFVALHKTAVNHLLCEQANGIIITVQCDPQVYLNPPPIGTIITITHRGQSSKTEAYTHPVFMRVNWTVNEEFDA